MNAVANELCHQRMLSSMNSVTNGTMSPKKRLFCLRQQGNSWENRLYASLSPTERPICLRQQALPAGCRSEARGRRSKPLGVACAAWLERLAGVFASRGACTSICPLGIYSLMKPFSSTFPFKYPISIVCQPVTRPNVHYRASNGLRVE